MTDGCSHAGQDYCVIQPPAQVRPTVVDTYEDHRMAMAFSLAAIWDLNFFTATDIS